MLTIFPVMKLIENQQIEWKANKQKKSVKLGNGSVPSYGLESNSIMKSKGDPKICYTLV